RAPRFWALVLRKLQLVYSLPSSRVSLSPNLSNDPPRRSSHLLHRDHLSSKGKPKPIGRSYWDGDSGWTLQFFALVKGGEWPAAEPLPRHRSGQQQQQNRR